MAITYSYRLIRTGLVLTTLLATAPAFAQLNFDFSTSVDGWQGGSRPNGGGNPLAPPNSPLTNTNAILTYQATGGNLGGFAQMADDGGEDMVFYRNFAGGTDLSALLNGTFSFDAIQLVGTANYAPFGRVRFYSSDGASANSNTDDIGAAFDIVPGTTSPAGTWTTYSGGVTATNFIAFSPGNTATLAQILGNVIRIEITAESTSGVGIETVGFDNVRFTAVVPEPGTVALFLVGMSGLALLRRRRA